MKVYGEVHGCPANLSDYEMAMGLLKESGIDFCSSPSASDLNIIFTCCVKTPTISRMVHRITKLAKTDKPLVVAGCMPKVMRSAIEKISPSASLVGPDSIEKITDAVAATAEGKKFVWLRDLRRPKVFLPKSRKNPMVDVIEISTGCLGSCSYCNVKFAKGKLSSYPQELIVKEAERALKDGCRELWLTSQDSSCYGKDIGSNLPELLKSVCKIDGRFFVRVGMMNPVHAEKIVGELVDAYKSEKVFKFLHLPAQSFSPRTLKLMKRDYSPKTALEIIKKFYKAFPDLTLSTDIIVGFPQESDSDFDKTLDFLKKVKPDIVNISKFGSHPGTEAEKLEQLPRNIINKRSKKLFEIVKDISLEKNQKWLGWSGECLIDEKGRKNTWVGRNFAYKPIVVQSDKNLLGKFIEVKITGAKSSYLIGNVV